MDFGSLVTGIVIGQGGGIGNFVGGAFALGLGVAGFLGLCYIVGRGFGGARKTVKAAKEGVSEGKSTFDSASDAFENLGSKIATPAQYAAGATVGLAKGAFKAGKNAGSTPAPEKDEQKSDVVEA